jgi:hypothetical protein
MGRVFPCFLHISCNQPPWEIEDIEYVVYVGPSSRQDDLKLSDKFRIKS